MCHNLKRRLGYEHKQDSERWHPFKDWHSYTPLIMEILMRYKGRCRFCWLIIEGFWLYAEPLGYKRNELSQDFMYIRVNVRVTEGEGKELLVSYRDTYDSKKECPAVWEKWDDQGWVFTIEEGSTLCRCSLRPPSNADDRAVLTLVALWDQDANTKSEMCRTPDPAMVEHLYHEPQ